MSQIDEQEQYRKLTERVSKALFTKLRARLSPYFQIEETVFGGYAICTSENIILKVHIHGAKITVHRIFNSADMIITEELPAAVNTIAAHMESRVDELRDMDKAPIGPDKPFLVMIERSSGDLLFRVAYFHTKSYQVVGDAFAYDRKLLGWLPIEGINYDV